MMVWESLVIVEGIVGNHSEIAVGQLGGRHGGCWRMVRACIDDYRIIYDGQGLYWEYVGMGWESQAILFDGFGWKEGSQTMVRILVLSQQDIKVWLRGMVGDNRDCKGWLDEDDILTVQK